MLVVPSAPTSRQTLAAARSKGTPRPSISVPLCWLEAALVSVRPITRSGYPSPEIRVAKIYIKIETLWSSAG